MSEYKSKDIQRLFNKSAETVRVWSERFSKYLSPTAQPGQGRHRLFTGADLEVFAYVAEQKAMGKTYDDIDVSLANGSRGSIPEVFNERSLVLESALQLEAASKELSIIQVERDEALAQVQALHDENIRLQTRLEEAVARQSMIEDQAQKQTQKQTEELVKLRSEHRELLIEIGSLRARLEMLQKREG